MTAPLVLTGGEPAGIGLEIAARAWAALRGRPDFVLIADLDHARAAARLAGGVAVVPVATPEEAAAVGRAGLPVLHHPFPGPAIPGRPQPAQAPEVVAVIARAVDLVRRGSASTLVTAPIHKAARQAGAGFAFPGHTEYLGSLAGDVRPVMMIAGPHLRVIPVTIHIPLADVPGALSLDLIVETARIAAAGLARDFAIARPRLAVAGLNPHAGEGGTIGREEIEIVAPAIARLTAEGLAVTGPHPADALFHARARAGYDAVLTMYHDQGLIPAKTLDFDDGVNVTLGLPFVRTSPDHGTAFDIAGRGLARPDSLIAALRMAAEMADRRG